MAEGEESELKLFSGSCPDSHCGKLLYFMSHVSFEVECSSCGQKHSPNSLLNIKESTDSNSAVGNLLKTILLSETKKGTELVKVRGLSNFHCKLVSPLLTKYGMDKKSGKAKLLSELGQPEVFNCSVFASRAFLIEKEHLDTPGYGRDNTGSVGYLKDTLGMIEEANSTNCLVPLHSDGDGHCLVHAISRAVIGRELLWHSLRQNLKDHLQQDNVKYQALFRDFVDIDEWDEIIAEADPNYHPETNEPFGLRNMHVFGLANVLHRPIILLDNLEGMQSSGDYSGIFLPVLVPSEQCKLQGVLNKPLVIAWSSSARNHYVPLVGIKDSPLPKIPRSLLPKAWGISNELVSTYVEFDESSCCVIGGCRSLPESYVERLVSAMDMVFFERHEVSPELVADVKQFVFKPVNAVGFSIPEITEFTQKAVESERLFRCLLCHAVKEVKDILPRSWREPGGKWYTMVQETDTGLVADAVYAFTDAKGVPLMYQAKYNMLVPAVRKDIECDFCKGVAREVTTSGTVRYMNGDRTSTKTTADNKGCKCGFKHYWNGNEHDNLPKTIDVSLEWNGKKIEEQVFWFDCESDPSLNSNVYEMATGVVQKHFPGEFGSETLVRKVVDKILRETELKKSEEAPANIVEAESQPMDTDSWETMPTTPSKIILTGPKAKTLHKEELTMSEEERLTRARITHRAAFSQKRKSSKESPEKSSGSLKLGKQEIHKTRKDNGKPHTANTSNVSKPPAPANATSGQAKPRDLKIRLTTADGRTATVTLKPASTYIDLQDAIHAQLEIPKDRQKIRYGFPPRELKPPEEEHAVLPLAHGDRVSVEELPALKAEDEERVTEAPEMMDVEAKETSTAGNNTSSGDGLENEGVDQEKLASDLLSLLQGALNVDRWETVQHQPELFARGGMIYDQVVDKLGPLIDDMHCGISGLPGKTFAYNAKEDRFEICLGQKHIPVQPLDAETLSLAHNRTGDVAPLRRPRDERESLGAFSGAVLHRDATQTRTAFSGAGRTLGGSAKTGSEEKKEDLPIMNVDVQYEVLAHVQSTTHDPSTSVDKPGNKDGEEILMDTGKCEELTNHVIPADIEMPAVKNDQSIAHEVGKNAHEASPNEHGNSSCEHEVSKIESVVNDKHEVEDSSHEPINSENVANSGENEVEQSEHKMSNVEHANSPDKPRTAEQGKNEFPSADNANNTTQN